MLKEKRKRNSIQCSCQRYMLQSQKMLTIMSESQSSKSMCHPLICSKGTTCSPLLSELTTLIFSCLVQKMFTNIPGLKLFVLAHKKLILCHNMFTNISGLENPTNVFAWTHKIWPNAIICSPVLEMSSDPTKICTEVLLFCLETKDKIQTRHF